MRLRVGHRIGPWMVRSVFESARGWSVRVHRFAPGSGDGCDPHDHPWDFVTVVLRGGYDDVSPGGVERLRAPAVRFRRDHVHVSRVHGDGALTLVLTGRFRRPWGFYTEDGWIDERRYREGGDYRPDRDRWAPCEELGSGLLERVRRLGRGER